MKSLLLLPTVILPAVFGADYLVSVGKNEGTGKKGIGFDPSVIFPTSGDTIVWRFNSGNHSVVQSTFENPCTVSGGFDSGKQHVSKDTPLDAPTLHVVRIDVKDKSPMWFFDEASGDCRKGAVFAVNPTQGQTADAFKRNAAKDPLPAPSVTIPSSQSHTATGAMGPSKTLSSPGSNGNKNTANHLNSGGGGALAVLSSFVVVLALVAECLDSA